MEGLRCSWLPPRTVRPDRRVARSARFGRGLRWGDRPAGLDVEQVLIPSAVHDVYRRREMSPSWVEQGGIRRLTEITRCGGGCRFLPTLVR
jgi:hypothetical protein